MFFSHERQQFFKPLTSKYRERVVHCLCLLYQRQYSSSADYGQSLNRDQVIEIFEEALVRAPVMEEDIEDTEEDHDNKSTREHANWILKQLLDSGWIEKQVDTATLQSTYPFTRTGRLFTQPLVEFDGTQIRTRHRNTRNTLNALEAFISRGEVHDLLDAFEYSERIVTDFTDIIAELEERKRELVREVESQQLVQQAAEQFFDFMDKRFQPDVSVRLSADSVEKHRDQINKAVNKIRRKKTDFKKNIELQLRRLVPDLAHPGQSVLWLLLDTIERRMSNAADVMLPALRKALHSFTKRADIIIRQLSYLNNQDNSKLLSVCKYLSELPEEKYKEQLEATADALASINIRLVDPGQIKLQERRQLRSVKTAVSEGQSLDKEAQRELMIQGLLDQAFLINNQALKEYLTRSLRKGRKVFSRDLPVDSAQDLLAMAHIIEVGAVNNLSSDLQYKVTPTGEQVTTEHYLLADEFSIELMTKQSA